MGWAEEELGSVELGDARRSRRLIKRVDELSAQPTGSIPLASGGLIGLRRADQERLAAQAVKHGWSVQALERARKKQERRKQVQGQALSHAERPDPDIQRLEAHLSESLGNPVQVRHLAQSGRVRMVMEFSSLEEFQGALERMNLALP